MFNIPGQNWDFGMKVVLLTWASCPNATPLLRGTLKLPLHQHIYGQRRPPTLNCFSNFTSMLHLDNTLICLCKFTLWIYPSVGLNACYVPAIVWTYLTFFSVTLLHSWNNMQKRKMYESFVISHKCSCNNSIYIYIYTLLLYSQPLPCLKLSITRYNRLHLPT